MTIQTVITWTPPVLPEVAAIFNAAAEQAELEGKTDNLPERSVGGIPLSNTTVRTWTTLVDAQDWIIFVTPYGPVSATIVTN